MVLLCLIMSVLSTVDQFEQISVEILFYMVGENTPSVVGFTECMNLQA
jgi:hypothetical protein